MDLQILLLFEIALLIIGLIGCFLPGLPGIPLVFSALLLQHFANPAITYPVWLLVLLSGLVLTIVALEYLLPIWGTKRFGASKWAVWGAMIGLVAGIFTSFLGPFTIILLPFLGAFLGELVIAKRPSKDSFKAALGALAGVLASTAMELLFSIALIIIFLFYQF